MRVSHAGSCAIAFALLVNVSTMAADGIRLREVLTSSGDQVAVQYVELEVYDDAARTEGRSLTIQDADGFVLAELALDLDGLTLSAGRRILVGTEAFSAAAAADADFVLPRGILPPFAGRICLDGEDCLAYGAYLGDNGDFGSPATSAGVEGANAIGRTRTEAPADNEGDWELRAPSAENNAGDSATIELTSLEVYFDDPMTDLSNWDAPTRGAGIDLAGCGIPATVDIGDLKFEGGEILFQPSDVDELDLGSAVSWASLSNEVAEAIIDQTEDEAYRVRLDIEAELGITGLAVFVRQHNDFIDGAFDPSQSSGMGVGMTFGCHAANAPDPCNDSASDHMHPDIRGACVQANNGIVSLGEDEQFLKSLNVVDPGETYTLILDVDGDDVFGPLTVQAKIFPAGTPEPPIYDASWQAITGLDASDDIELDRVFLLAATRSDGAALGPVLRMKDFEVSAIPDSQLFVRFLTGERLADGVLLTWENPFDAPDEDIVIRANGVVVGEVGGDAVEFLIEDEIDGDATYSVTNFSGVGTSVFVCENDAPVGLIEGPTEIAFDPKLAVTLDSSGSVDPEGGNLLRFWEFVDGPPDFPPLIEDPFAESITVFFEDFGEYRFELTLSDEGCSGDLASQSVTIEHSVIVTKDLPSGFLRGDCNASTRIDLSDAVFFLNHLFTGGDTPPCLDACNSNGDGNGDLSDAVFLLNHLFIGGVGPPPPNECGFGEIVVGCEQPAC